ncbi:hypothetical protein L3V83_11110 [Thiotrichales bacterium 19X7-9]|nr:hypothetical protein [Thiotrichales bacterium 19X7-9]
MKNLQDEMEYNKLLMPITSGDIYSFTYTIYTQLFINLLDLANSEKEQLLGHHQPKSELLKHLNKLLLNSNDEEARDLTTLFFVKLLDDKKLISIVDKNELHKRINTSINEKENKENKAILAKYVETYLAL